MRGSLRKVLNDPNTWRQFTPPMRNQVLMDVAEGMEFLHAHNVYHRDLKSHNVLITEWGRAKLTDFGLSKTTNAVSSFTGRSTMGGGTVAWMPPESFGKRLSSALSSSKSDVYSYSIVTWEVLAGTCGVDMSTPWYGKAIVEVIAAVSMRGERPPLADECIEDTNVSRAELHADIMQRCWAADPADRPTFSDLLALMGVSQA
ncbi:kinase-like domain-containing protein [Tribonema minus]|uniref:Kinase-like domain-containing protein n=1 Tax=Tribonema minus TaxID=303371 RepID=A0A835YXR6_9STRA|nr:kinase-like domain-containing protein [Tribonema minus]